MRHGQKGVYVIACGVSSHTHLVRRRLEIYLVRRRNESTWCGGETSTSISDAMFLKKNKTKSSTEIQSTAIVVHEAKRTATSTRTISTRHNKPYRLGAAPAGLVGTPSRCCPAATVPAAVVFGCGFRCCFAEMLNIYILLLRCCCCSCLLYTSPSPRD